MADCRLGAIRVESIGRCRGICIFIISHFKLLFQESRFFDLESTTGVAS